MAVPRYIKLERVLLQNHPDLDERWVQARIGEDPAVLGLGDLILKDKERTQPHAGRLDLLLQERAANRRYEVEVQLGSTDESHIIRTVEYWEIERRRYPLYEHCAVIVAEDITSRFLNIIGLFNGAIPLIAIQMQAFRVNADEVTLVFTTVLDELVRGPEDEEEEIREWTDRAYWEGRGTPATMATLDGVFKIVQELDPSLELKFNKFYVGLATDGQPHNFVRSRPQKKALMLTIRLRPSPEIQARLEESGLETLDYNKREGYRIRLGADDLKNRGDVLRQLIEMAFRNHLG